MNNNEMKRLAAKEALNYLWDGMLLGVGTGSTVEIFIEEIGKIKDNISNIKCVASSIKTETLLTKNGFKVVELKDKVDLYIDGADAVDKDLNLIKGGGGALTREKIVAYNSKKNIIIVDETKLKNSIFEVKIPVEILPFSWEATKKRVEEKGFSSQLRYINNELFITDNRNYIIDIETNNKDMPLDNVLSLKNIPGVVEIGLFSGLTDILIVGQKNGIVKKINKNL